MTNIIRQNIDKSPVWEQTLSLDRRNPQSSRIVYPDPIQAVYSAMSVRWP